MHWFIPGEFPLIGASASCSSYQQPRRGRGGQLLIAMGRTKAVAIAD